jgi:hypothetical protein
MEGGRGWGTHLLLSCIYWQNSGSEIRICITARNYDMGCSSRNRSRDPYFLPIPDPGSRDQKEPDTGSGFATLCIGKDMVLGGGGTLPWKNRLMSALIAAVDI